MRSGLDQLSVARGPTTLDRVIDRAGGFAPDLGGLVRRESDADGRLFHCPWGIAGI